MWQRAGYSRPYVTLRRLAGARRAQDSATPVKKAVTPAI